MDLRKAFFTIICLHTNCADCPLTKTGFADCIVIYDNADYKKCAPIARKIHSSTVQSGWDSEVGNEAMRCINECFPQNAKVV